MARERSNWMRLRVAERVIESDIVVSLHLVQEDGGALAPFLPGQFLTLKVPGPAGRPAPRTYSLSGDPGDLSRYRISVKLERAPAGRSDLTDGLGSGFVHGLAVGDGLESLPPRGDFILDETSLRPVLLLAGGIGITPLASMAHALARQGTRSVTLIHACETGQAQALATELRALEQRSPKFRHFTCLASPSDTDLRLGVHHKAGLVDPDFLRSVLPIGDYDVYLCGPAGFMQAMYRHLLELGVREERIRYEFFGAGAPLTAAPVPSQAPAPPLEPATAPALDADGGAVMVTFSASNITAPWDPAYRTILDFAEAQGLTPAFSCRNGICNTCLCAIEGGVTYVEEPLDRPDPGKALICCSVPAGSLALRL
jgi:ferredoxin-NADP reductase